MIVWRFGTVLTLHALSQLISSQLNTPTPITFQNVANTPPSIENGKVNGGASHGSDTVAKLEAQADAI